MEFTEREKKVLGFTNKDIIQTKYQCSTEATNSACESVINQILEDLFFANKKFIYDKNQSQYILIDYDYKSEPAITEKQYEEWVG